MTPVPPVAPPRFVQLRSLRRRSLLKLGLEVALVALGLVWLAAARELISFVDLGPVLLAPAEAALLLALTSACWAAVYALHRRVDGLPLPAEDTPSADRDTIALLALPAGFPGAWLSRLPLVARVLCPRLHFREGALDIAWSKRWRRVPYRELARADWRLDGVLLVFRDGRRLLLPTCRAPRASGPSDHHRELRHAVQSATLAVLRHNQRIAERIELECARVECGAYRAPARAL